RRAAQSAELSRRHMGTHGRRRHARAPRPCMEKNLMATAIQPDRILRELADLWVSYGKQDGGESTGVLRACSMTLIVAADAREDAADVGETLAVLMREHPSRAIVVRVSADGPAELEARVLAQCWSPIGHGKRICCEQIEISCSPETIGDVPGVVLPL